MPEPRLLVKGDVEKLRRLLRTCWLDTYKGILPGSVIQTAITVWQSKESLLRGLQNPQAFYSGCFEDGKLVGMVSAGKIDEGTVKIFQLYVLPSHQRRGIGSRLMDAAIRRFRGAGKVVLEVEDGNQRAFRSTASTVSHTRVGLWSRSAERRFLACLVNYVCRVSGQATRGWVWVW